jgi:hypothetical protein
MASSTEYRSVRADGSSRGKFQITRLRHEVAPATIVRRCRQAAPRSLDWSDTKTPNDTYGWRIVFEPTAGRRIEYAFRTAHPYAAFESLARQGVARGRTLTDWTDSYRAALSVFEENASVSTARKKPRA